mgnify:CR=1 FL=1
MENFQCKTFCYTEKFSTLNMLETLILIGNSNRDSYANPNIAKQIRGMIVNSPKLLLIGFLLFTQLRFVMPNSCNLNNISTSSGYALNITSWHSPPQVLGG